MFGRNSLRCSIVALCAALLCIFSVQRILINIVTVKHDLHLSHDASPLAGMIVDCGIGEKPCEGGADSHFPVFHIHTAIDAGANLLVDWRDVLPSLRLSVVQFNPSDQGFYFGKGHLAPERPPKA